MKSCSLRLSAANKGTTYLTYIHCSELALLKGVGFPSKAYRQMAGRQRNRMSSGDGLWEGLSWWMEENMQVLLGSFWNAYSFWYKSVICFRGWWGSCLGLRIKEWRVWNIKTWNRESIPQTDRWFRTLPYRGICENKNIFSTPTFCSAPFYQDKIDLKLRKVYYYPQKEWVPRLCGAKCPVPETASQFHCVRHSYLLSPLRGEGAQWESW